MLSVSGLTKHYGGHTVLDAVSFVVKPGQRVALVGRNGCGKTTLLRIIAGLLPSDGGSVSLGPSERLGYLGQEGQLEPDNTLYQEMAAVFAEVFSLESELRAMEQDLSTDARMSRYAELRTRYELLEPHTVDARIRTVCAGLGFQESDLSRSCREFSGGWQMRGAMARLLLSQPDLLLLDEPTNHLDIQAVEWLEQFLTSYSGSVLIVSHDRAFLDRVVTRTLELSEGEIEEFAGNYSYYLEESERRFEQQMAAFRNQQKKIEKDQRFIERFRYKATLATRVKSREKMLQRLDLVEIPRPEERSINVTFQAAVDSGREALTARGLRKSYGSRLVLDNVSVKVDRGDKIALVGPNGAGKSTLLRMLSGIEAPDEGKVSFGYRVLPVYFAQHQAEALNTLQTPLDALSEVAPRGTNETVLRTLLGSLLFRGGDVYKRISVLSGGERSRVALARCILTPSNLLMLDEPTNHLDISSREVLLEALQDYPGTILLVTHDRHFMDQLATTVWEVTAGRVRVYPGNYGDYKRAKEKEAPPPAAAAPVAKKKPAAMPRAASVVPKQKTFWKLEALEKKIFSLEEEIAGTERQLADPELYKRPAEARELQERYDALKLEVADLTQIWDEMTA